jgi:uncharacterized protein
MKLISAISLLSLLLQASAWADDITLHIGMHEIHARVANTYLSRKLGLMHNTQLCEQCGMLFVFPIPGKYKFWMKDTPLPLSIAFVSANGRIQNTEEMEANSVKLHSAQRDALYALEMNKGWFAEHGIKTNELVHGLKNAPRGK